MTTMRTDAKKTLRLWQTLSNDEVEYALGQLLLSKVYADKVLAMLSAYATQKNLKEEFNKK